MFKDPATVELHLEITTGSYTQGPRWAEEEVGLTDAFWGQVRKFKTTTLENSTRGRQNTQRCLSDVSWKGNLFNIDYVTGPFALFFMAEYINIILINALSIIVFIGPFHNSYSPELYTTNFIIKTLTLTTLFLWIWASYRTIFKRLSECLVPTKHTPCPRAWGKGGRGQYAGKKRNFLDTRKLNMF